MRCPVEPAPVRTHGVGGAENEHDRGLRRGAGVLCNCATVGDAVNRIVGTIRRQGVTAGHPMPSEVPKDTSSTV